MRKFYLLILIGIIPITLFALRLSGVVTDRDGEPIEYVNILTETGIYFSNEKGAYQISVRGNEEEITFSKLGYAARSYKAGEIPKRIVLEISPMSISGISVHSDAYQEFYRNHDKIVIDMSEPRNLYSLLSERAEINIGRVTLSGERQTVSLGGHSDRHTIIMIDGLVVSKPGETFDLSLIPLSSIDKIEIIRQNASILGGSGGIGGIIHFITDQADGEEKAAISYQRGSYGKHHYHVNTNVRRPTWRFNLSISRQEAENNFSYQNPLVGDESVEMVRDNNHYKGWDIHSVLAKRYKLLESRYTFSLKKAEKGLPGPISSVQLFDRATMDMQSSRHHLMLKYNNPIFIIHSDAYYFDERSIYDNTRSTMPVHHEKTDTDYQKLGASLNMELPWQVLALNLKYEAQSEHLQRSSQRNNIDASMQNHAISAGSEIEMEHEGWTAKLNLASRYDFTARSDTAKFDDILSWQIAPRVLFEDRFTLRIGGAYGTSFSLPSFFDLYFKGDTQAVGNIDLRPETSKGWNVFFEFQIPDFRLRLGYYENKIEDLIYWYRSVNAWKPGNVASAQITSLEAETEIRLSQIVSSGANWSRTYALDKTSDSNTYNRPLIYRPRSRISAFVKLNWQDFTSKIRYSRYGKQWTNRYTDHNTIPAYHIVDCFNSKTIRLDADWEAKLHLNINNLFDQAYELYSLTPAAGRIWECGITIKINR
jgi:vitamin B12 transporter